VVRETVVYGIGLSRGVPRLGMGSSSWAGKEKRTAAISETPMNLEVGVSGRAAVKK